MMIVGDLRRLMSRLVIASLAVIVLVAAIAHAQLPAPVAQVAEEAIRHTDVEYRLKMEQAYGNTAATVEAAAVALINEAVEREVARQVGVAATIQEIRQLAQHADATSQAPGLLKQIKTIFTADQASYQRLFLEPRITSGKLHDYQRFSPQLQQDQRRLIERALAGLKQGKSLQQAAKDGGLEAVISDIEDKPIEFPDALMRLQTPNQSAPKDPLIPLLRNRLAGEFIPNIVEDDSSYRIVRLISKEQHRYRIATVRAAKASYDAWYKSQCAKVTVSFADLALEKVIRVRYPGLCWIEAQ